MNFYKITNKKENHNGLQYKTGLNIDPLPWNPSGNCESGGIYFSREDIFAFINYGPWIRKVTIPEDAEVYENPGKSKKWKAHKVLLGERKKISINIVRSLLEQGANIHASDDMALKWASENGYLKTVKLLLEYGADVNSGYNQALRYASKYGHQKIVKFLLKQGADVHANNDLSLVYASGKGHLKIVELLIEYGANVHADNGLPLLWASKNGHTKVIDLLLQHGATQ